MSTRWTARSEHGALRNSAQGVHVERRLHGGHPPLQALGAFAGFQWNLLARENGSAVVFRIHQVNTNSADLGARRHDGLVHTSPIHSVAAEFRQRARMNVENSVRIPCENLRTELTQIPRKNNQFDVMPDHFLHQPGVGGLRVGLRGNTGRRNTDLSREAQRGRRSIIAHHQPGLSRERAYLYGRHDGARA